MGEVVAQLNVGMAYDTGTGVPQNYAEAYFWLDLAAAPGETGAEGVKQKDIAKHRDEVASHLTKTELSQVQERARRWFEDHTAKANPQ